MTLSITHIRNFNLLATYMGNLPASYTHFDMESYFHDPRLRLATEQDEMVHSHDLIQPVEGMCGCLLGHSAAAGIPITPSQYGNWHEFALDAFGVSGREYDYLFGGEWYVEDNTVAGALRRIDTFVTGGVPKDFQ